MTGLRYMNSIKKNKKTKMRKKEKNNLAVVKTGASNKKNEKYQTRHRPHKNDATKGNIDQVQGSHSHY